MHEDIEVIDLDVAFATSPTLGGIAKALAQAQSKFPTIPKTKTGKIKGRTRDGRDYDYEYKYADLADVVDVIAPILAENGLAVSQSPVTRTMEDGHAKDCLVTLLMHADGEWIRARLDLISMAATPQGQGSAITYARRYAYGAMTGAVTDVDEDGALGTAEAESGTGRPPPRQNRSQSRSGASRGRPRASSSAPDEPAGDEPPRDTPTSSQPSAKQSAYLRALLSDIGVPDDRDTRHAFLSTLVDGIVVRESTKELNKAQVSKLIDHLRDMVEQDEPLMWADVDEEAMMADYVELLRADA